MLSNNILAYIGSCAIKKGYNGNSLNFEGNGYKISTPYKYGHIIIIKIEKNDQNIFMLCNEGSQNMDDYITDFNAMNNNKKKKVKNFNGKVTKSMWDEFTKYRHYYETFIETFKNDGELVVCGHSLGGAVAGIAAGIYNLKCVLLAPVPFVGHSNWSKNYSTHPVSFVNPTDPCCSDRVGINWKAGNHIGKQWINNDVGLGSHKIDSFVSYFQNKCNFNIL